MNTNRATTGGTASVSTVDWPVVLLASTGVLALSLVLQHEFDLRQALLFLLGVGLGIALLHSAYGFSGSWRIFILDRKGVGLRSHCLLLALSSLLFLPLVGEAFPDIRVSPALAPVGVSVLVGAFLFGIGMQLGGGCGSGTLYTVGGGHIRMLITFVFFIAGAFIGSLHLPWWLSLPDIGTVSMTRIWGWAPTLVLQLAVLAGIFLWVVKIERNRHGRIEPLFETAPGHGLAQTLAQGSWPRWWGVVALTVLGLATLLLAGHPWSITFAFGLWGAKIATALGADPAAWAYWNSDYAWRALNSSVLQDVTSVMDFGIILGAVLAAGMAGKFAPASKLRRNGVIAAVAGGLLLGYGARLAFGCNIGALLGGISTGSLYGWLWFVAAFAGAFVGVWLRALLHMDKTRART